MGFGFRHPLAVSLALAALLSVLFAQGEEQNLAKALGGLCDTVRNVLAIGFLLLIVLAAVVYAVGQIMGAETRARASVWATAMFTGAIMGALIYIIAPYIIGILVTGDPGKGQQWVTDCCKPDITSCPI